MLRAGEQLLARRKLDRPMRISGVYTLGKVLSFVATEPVLAEDIRKYYGERARHDVLPDLPTLNRRFLGSLPLVRTKRR